jgi:hypothetical protein
MVISIWIDYAGNYSEHSVTGVGYADSTTPPLNFAVVHDTWDQSMHIIDLDNLWGVAFTSAVPQ